MTDTLPDDVTAAFDDIKSWCWQGISYRDRLRIVSMCRRKERHSPAGARRTADALHGHHARRGQQTGHPVSVYQCELCTRYHVGGNITGQEFPDIAPAVARLKANLSERDPQYLDMLLEYWRPPARYAAVQTRGNKRGRRSRRVWRFKP